MLSRVKCTWVSRRLCSGSPESNSEETSSTPNAKNVFASVTCVAVIGAMGDALATAPPQIMHPGPVRPCCSGSQAQVTGWMKFKTAFHTPASCSTAYLKFVSASGVQFGRGYGNAASGKCFYKFNVTGIKGPSTGLIYIKIGDPQEARGIKWAAGQRVRIAPKEHTTLNLKYEPPQE